jgi:3-oxoacyl-[acyl-carrier protein] reductase
MGKLTGQVALVTGAARGLGRDYALHLASLGAAVGVIDINFHSFEDFKGEAELLTADNVIDELRAMGVPACGATADITDREQVFAAVQKIADELGDISIVITNAGGGMGPPDGNKASSLDWDMYHTVINRNLHGTVYTVNAVVPMMKKNRHGKIVTVASVGGLVTNSDGSYSHYAMAKAAVIHYTHYLAAELGEYNINANCIARGYMATGRLKEQYHQAGEETFLSRSSIKRFGTPEDCSKAVEFLVTDQSDFITGHVLEVSGGVSGRIRVD